MITVKILNIRTPEKLAVTILKLEQRVMHHKDVEGMANSVDTDQTAPYLEEQSYLGIHVHCLPWPI